MARERDKRESTLIPQRTLRWGEMLVPESLHEILGGERPYSVSNWLGVMRSACGTRDLYTGTTSSLT